MTRVEQIEAEVQRMSAEELAAFRRCFAQFDADAWDAQIPHDAQAGRTSRD